MQLDTSKYIQRALGIGETLAKAAAVAAAAYAFSRGTLSQDEARSVSHPSPRTPPADDQP